MIAANCPGRLFVVFCNAWTGPNDMVTFEAMPTDSLPNFRKPPIVEVVVGVQFRTIPKWGNAHFGAFWRALSGDWPNVSDAPPIPSQYEHFGDELPQLPFDSQLKPAAMRLRIRSADGCKMIQVQSDGLRYNWLGHGGNDYPSYQNVKRKFDGMLQDFQAFLEDNSLGTLHPNQWELIYVNHIPKDGLWSETQDWRNVFPSLGVLPTPASSLELEGFGGDWHYEIVPCQGRLHVQVGNCTRKVDTQVPEEILIMNLAARGPVDGGSTDLDRGLTLGHETIVTAFAELTSKTAHEYWERIDG